MQRSIGSVSAIQSLGYPGWACLSRCECDELPCPLLSWLSAQLRVHCPELKGGGGDLLLAGELKNMLSEISCPLFGLASEVLDLPTLNKITDFFVSELQAALIIKHKEVHLEEKTTQEESPKEQRVEDVRLSPYELCQENEDGTDKNRRAEMQSEWKLVLDSLNLNSNSPITDVLSEVESRLTNLPCDVMAPLLKTTLSAEQWIKLELINDILSSDYKCRKQMMIKRFQVTLDSFAWGDKEKEQSKVLDTMPLTSLVGSSTVSLPLALAARVNQSCIEPIRSGKSTQVYRVLMGAVPDRGGRPGELEPPMPAWESRKSGHRSGRGGGSQKWHKNTDKIKKKR